MPTTKLFDITLGDINFLLDQMSHTIVVVGYDSTGQALYGYRDANAPTGYQTLGPFGSFDPLLVNGPDGLPIYQGARDPAGLRIIDGFFNNLTGTQASPGAWLWGAVDSPFERLTQAKYDHYVNQVLSNPALATYVANHPGFTPVTDNTANYANPMTTVVDYTPRMITQTISTSYGGHDPATAVGTGATLNGVAAASSVFSQGQVLVITIGGTATVFEFYNGSHANNGNLIFIDISSGTINDALAAIQTGLRAHGGDVNATVGLVGGHVTVALGSSTVGDLTISDFAGLGLDGTFSPTPNSDSALLRVGAATDTFTETVTYADGHTAEVHETVVRNQNTLPGDPSTSGIFTLFGQFFDHGLDFINKGGQGAKIVIPLSSTDPLYRAPGTLSASDPGNTTMTISRATPDGYTVTDLHGRQLSIAGTDRQWGTSDDLKAPGPDGVYGTGDDVPGAIVKPAAAPIIPRRTLIKARATGRMSRSRRCCGRG
jgi:hypothetical protein